MTAPDARLLALLVCPVTRRPLGLDRVAGVLVAEGSDRTYPLRDGVPLLLAGEGRGGCERDVSPVRP